MTRIWKLQDAKARFSELIRAAEREPQVITRHGKTVGVLYGPDLVPHDLVPQSAGQPRTALEALRGDFDFSDMPEGEWLERDRAPYLAPDPLGEPDPGGEESP